MHAVIISVGTEYLVGTLPEPDAEYLAGRLSELGLDLSARMMIGDSPSAVKDALDYAFGRAPVVVMTGAVGPGKNPAVNALLAEYFGRKLVRNERVAERLRLWEKETQKTLPDQEKESLCLIPEGALTFVNDAGITPGYVLEAEKKSLIMLPGARTEMEETFENDAVGYIFRIAAAGTAELILTLAPESGRCSERELRKKLGEWGTYENPEVTIARKDGKAEIRVRAVGPTKGDAKILARIAGTNVSQRLGEQQVLDIREV